MRIKLIEGSDIKTLVYRPWNGVQYGVNTAEEIVKEYAKTTYDRASGAYIMSRAEHRFWERYFAELSEDERQIREAYLVYHPSDVEEYLRRELDLAGDDVRLHHQARQHALKALAKDFPVRAKSLNERSRTQRMTVTMNLSAKKDDDIIDFFRQRERLGERRADIMRRLFRIGLRYEQQVEAQREEQLEKMRKEKWI